MTTNLGCCCKNVNVIIIFFIFIFFFVENISTVEYKMRCINCRLSGVKVNCLNVVPPEGEFGMKQSVIFARYRVKVVVS